MKEAELQTNIIAMARLFKFRVAHFRPARVKCRACRGTGRAKGIACKYCRGAGMTWRTAVEGDGEGFPDLILAKERLFIWELKSEKGIVSEAQQDWLDVLSKVPGVDARVIRPKDWLDGTVERLLRGA